MKINNVSFGIRTDTISRRYLLPRDTAGKNHPYFEYFIWWLWFYIAKPKKCPMCGKCLTGKGEWVQSNYNTGKRLKTMCYPCAEKLGEPLYIFEE